MAVATGARAPAHRSMSPEFGLVGRLVSGAAEDRLLEPLEGNRARRSGSAATCEGSTFTATSRFSFVSVARYTSPIPPSPIWAVTSYGPRQVPGVRAKLSEY